MNDVSEVKSLGHGLFCVQNKTVNARVIAENIVEHQDGDTVACLVRYCTGLSCEFLTGDLWCLDESRDCDHQEIAKVLYQSLAFRQSDSDMIQLILDYCGPFRHQRPVAVH